MPETPPHGFRTFVIIWVTQSISALGSSLTFFALTIWITVTLYPLPEQKAELAFALSAIGLAFGVPVVFAAPVAGAWADRHDRKRTMLVVDFLSGALSLSLAALVLSGSLQLWPVLVITALFAVLGAFHMAAFDTSYVMLVPPKHLPRANGMMQTTWSLASIVAPAIAATIIALPSLARQGVLPLPPLTALPDGTALVLFIDAATFFLAGLVLPFLNVPSPRPADQSERTGAASRLWSDVALGWRYIWQRRPLLWLLGTFTLVNLLFAPAGVLTPLLLKFNLAPSWMALGLSYEASLALVNSAGGIGGFIGGLLISTWGGLKTRRIYGVLVPIVVSAIGVMVFGLTSYVYVAAAMVIVRSMMTPLMNSHSQSIWQTQTPPELQGRVFAVRRLIAQFTWPLGTALAGFIGGAFDISVVITLSGAIVLVFTVAQFFNPALLRVEDKAWLDRMAASVADARS
ncbi:MAG: MFS transporter [Anaerolineae bacterium]